MKKLIITILVIALILLGTTLSLNGVANANAQKEHLEKLRTLLPGSSEFTLEPYSGEDANIRSVHKTSVFIKLFRNFKKRNRMVADAFKVVNGVQNLCNAL